MKRAIVVVVLMLVGCGGPKHANKTVADVTDHLKKNGVDVRGTKDAAPILRFGAADASKVSIGESYAIVCRYDPADSSQMKILHQIETDGSVVISFLGTTTKSPAHVNGVFVLTNYENCPDKSKLVAAFKSF